MKCLLLTAALLVAPAVAWADGVKLVECRTVELTGVVSCPVNLVKGRDYILTSAPEGGGTIHLINPQGQNTITLESDSHYTIGREFRAAYTATYRVEARGGGDDDPTGDDDGASGALYTDCKGTVGTQCALPLGKTVSGAMSHNVDADFYRTPALTRGRTYRLTFTTLNWYYTKVSVVKADGTKIVGGHVTSDSKTKTLSFRAPINGPVYVRTEQGSRYSLLLR